MISRWLLFLFRLIGFRYRGCVDEKYYKSSSEIKCKDGSKRFTRAQLNDDFCDCADGTDEPGSSFIRLVSVDIIKFEAFILCYDLADQFH